MGITIRTKYWIKHENTLETNNNVRKQTSPAQLSLRHCTNQTRKCGQNHTKRALISKLNQASKDQAPLSNRCKNTWSYLLIQAIQQQSGLIRELRPDGLWRRLRWSIKTGIRGRGVKPVGILQPGARPRHRSHLFSFFFFFVSLGIGRTNKNSTERRNGDGAVWYQQFFFFFPFAVLDLI